MRHSTGSPRSPLVPDQAAAHHPVLARSLAWTAGHASGWRLGTPRDDADVTAAYREQTAHADWIITRLGPDARPRRPQGGRMRRPHHVILHVLVETATHAGPLGIIPEGIDRKQFLVVHS
jgi:hypothetical protein